MLSLRVHEVNIFIKMDPSIIAKHGSVNVLKKKRLTFSRKVIVKKYREYRKILILVFNQMRGGNRWQSAGACFDRSLIAVL